MNEALSAYPKGSATRNAIGGLATSSLLPQYFASLTRLAERLCRAESCVVLLDGPDGLLRVDRAEGANENEAEFLEMALGAVDRVSQQDFGATVRAAAPIIGRSGERLGLVAVSGRATSGMRLGEALRETMIALADEAAAIIESTGLELLPDRNALCTLADTLPAIIWMQGGAGALFVSDRAYEITGVDRGEAVTALFEKVHPEDRAILHQACEDAFVRRVEVRYRIAHRDGAYHWHAAAIAPVTDLGGSHAVGVAVDIDGHLSLGGIQTGDGARGAQLNIFDRQQIWTLSQDLLAVLDLGGHILDANPAWTDGLGHGVDGLLGADIFTLIHPDDRQAARACLALAMDGSRDRQGEYRIRDAAGRYRPVTTSVRVDSRHVYFYGRDMSAQRESEEQLRQAQKMEAVGQLTGGVAHDFNNLLTVILGNAESLVDTLSADTEARLHAELVMSAAERGAELTGRMLAFARRQPLDARSTDVTRLLGDLERLLRRTIGESFEIEFVHAAGLWPALVDPGQLESAIVNLCINARDAMGRSGRITIETANMHLDEGYSRQHSEVQPGQYVMIAVSDTGCGMSPETMARAFEPFFTTKPVGEGTGLGLSMIYGFIKQSGGHIMLYSELGVGTVVRLYLPRSQAVAAGATERRTDGAPMGNETVLVVEDEAMVRDHLTKQLDSLGYRCIPAQNAAVALALLRSPIPVDLMFTDLVMPGGMNGRELAEEARRLRPELKVLFSSGYAENALLHQGRLPRGAHLLQKPYRRQALAEKVRAVLDGDAASA
ncbi:PAS domain S-box protein [Arsenicitalea aurantiaca]|uniref:histidine kinase n=1 Tax=Arsenicitalea aurantiaca TaxID=1783274 RepID=A0A433XBB1_9HYPH|nr:PAS domain-containing hybrid sensor histidine kinase/response regulator [Arsenicitalea aurantiaca]RUT31352.1 PAS domain S-box protein [Arsenicitalea aurantiaca]